MKLYNSDRYVVVAAAVHLTLPPKKRRSAAALSRRDAMARRSLMRRGFLNLRLAVCQSTREAAASRAHGRRVGRRALRGWRAASALGSTVKAMMGKKSLESLSRVLGAWRQHCKARRCKAEAIAVAARHRRHVRLYICFRSWRGWLWRLREVLRLPAQPDMEQTAAKGRAAMLKKRGYDAWRDYVSVKRLPKVRNSAGDMHIDQHLV